MKTKKYYSVLSLFFVFLLACQLISQPPATSSTETLEATLQPITADLQPELTDAYDVPMVLVPAGEFTMGKNAEDALIECQKFGIGSGCELAWFTDNEPPHQVFLEDYYIDKYEVTNASYKACVKEGVCDLPFSLETRLHDDYYSSSEFDNSPVVNVNWDQAKTFCEWRGTQLPTEAQWEKAARGTDERNYPWGGELSCSNANYSECSGDITEVGSYESGVSPYGVYDMAGNVSEWVADWYQQTYYFESPSSNPSGPDSGEKKIIRGSAVYKNKIFLATYARDGLYPNQTLDDGGFRCAADLPTQEIETVNQPVQSQAESTDITIQEITDDFDVPMMLVPEGGFTMGSEINDDEKPIHQVYLDAYYIDKYEVTNANYRACVDAGKCSRPGYPKIDQTTGQRRPDNYENPEFDNYPVVYIDWKWAKTYCEWRGGYLPTEAQWEKAARGTNGRTYPWGEDKPSDSCRDSMYYGCSVAEVGSYEKNVSPYGLYDMAGNVSEWVADYYDANFYQISPQSNPLGPKSGETRVLRSWRLATDRSYDYPTRNDLDSNGFRCVRTP
jgi:formylglycine-generating enzyme required for sulfatase activity